MEQSYNEKLRIILAITQKDLTDGIKNKNIIAIVLTSLFIVVLYKYLPALMVEDNPPALLVYAPGDSMLLSGLQDSSAVDLYTYESATDMKYYLTNGEQPELGLEIPAGFDSSIEAGDPLELKGYMLHLFEDEKYQLKRYMEEEFLKILGKPVRMSIEIIPLVPESSGLTIMSSLGFVYITLIVGMMVIPHMMIEEKQTKTLDALLISPAGSGQIIIAKAFTGLVYSMVMLLIALVFNYVLIQHGWLFLLGGLAGALFAISLGLLFGILIDSKQQLTLWAWVAFIPLFIPMMLSIMDDLFPQTILQIFRWVPSSALFRIFRTSMAGITPPKYFAPQLTVLLASSGFLLMIDAWLVQRSSR